MTNAINIVNPINIFLGIREPNVTFCIDISGSMYSAINTVKEQLIQYLLEQSFLAKLNLNRLFNLIAFSTEVYPWATNMVLWNTSTVNTAINWIKDLETKTGTNTLDALITAFKDEFNNSVVLVTDDIPDQDPYQVLNQVSLYSKGRPVHCIYITSGREEDRSAIEFLQNLSTITRGFFKIVNVGRHGVEKITPINQDISSTIQLTNLSLNSNGHFHNQHSIIPTTITSSFYNPLTTANTINYNNINLATNTQFINSFLHPNWLNEPNVYVYPSFVSYPKVLVTHEGKIPSRSIAWSRFRPVKVLYDGTVCGLTVQNINLQSDKDIAYTPDAGSLLINKIVLARSNLDGFYYKGKVINQILAHRFMVQFGPNHNGQYINSSYQDTAIYDIIHYDDALLHSIKTNDKVLALIDEQEKYAPAEVLEGFEKRGLSPRNENEHNQETKQLTVKFSNGKTRTLPYNEAIWLPEAVYERIKFEFNLPSTARQYLQDLNEEYPRKSLPGYPNNLNHSSSLEYVIMPRMVYDIWPYYVPYYPLYSNILYPTVSTVINSNLNSQFLTSLNQLTSAPTYYRTVKTKPAVVDAESVNKSIIGSVLTPDELDEKIRQQIHKNRHLLIKSRENSLEHSHSRNYSNSSNRSCKGCCCNNSRPVQRSCCSNQDEIEQEKKHYEQYLRRIHDLYESAKNEHSCSCSNFKRSKSVTFSSDCHSSSSRCGSRESVHYYDYESDDLDNSSKGINTEITFGKKSKSVSKKKQQDLKSNVPDRFGNPKVGIGLPDRPGIKKNSQSNLDNLDSSLISKSSENLNEAARRDHVARREQARIDRLKQENEKQELKDQYHRNYTNQLIEFEKRRTDSTHMKNVDRNLGKSELKALTNQRFDSNKIDIEAKEQAKISYLKNQVNKRNLANEERLRETEQKEANRLAYKKVEQEKRNQLYHDRLLVEEAFRKAQQKEVSNLHHKQKAKEAIRENKDLKINSIKQNLKEHHLLKVQSNLLFPTK